jgi:hypothetical protein
MPTLAPLANPTLPNQDPRVTDSEPPTTSIAQDWNAILDTLRRRYPGNRDSTLYCIFKLQQNPDLGLRDLRDEAELHGLVLAGRSLHSARVLLGLEGSSPPKEAPAAATPSSRPAHRQRRQAAQREGDHSIEDRVIQAVRQIQDAAGAQTVRLRAAIEHAIAILQEALDEE